MENLLTLIAGFGLLVGGIVGFLIGERSAKGDSGQTVHLHQADRQERAPAIGFGLPGAGAEEEE